MAKNTKGDGSLEQNGSTVVTPDNIGQGIKWNSATKKYDVQIAQNQPIVINDNGELEVRVSKLENNQLRLMKDGLYYGNQARPELANLYVDAVNGVDQDPLKVQGAGTKAKPLKSLQFAMQLHEQGTNRTVFLHEDQDHICTATNYKTTASGELKIQGYGPTYDKEYAEKPSGDIALMAIISAGKIPRLHFSGYRTWKNNNNTSGGYIHTNLVFSNCYVYFLGIHLINDLDFTYVPILPVDNQNLSNKEPWRINLLNKASVLINFCKLSSQGETKTNSHPALINAGLNEVGFFQGISCDVTFYMVRNNLADDCKCVMFAKRGWSVAQNSSTLISANVNTEANKSFIAKAIRDIVKDEQNGVIQIKAPTIDLESKYFN